VWELSRMRVACGGAGGAAARGGGAQTETQGLREDPMCKPRLESSAQVEMTEN
jgi:hypothetical protein